MKTGHSTRLLALVLGLGLAVPVPAQENSSSGTNAQGGEQGGDARGEGDDFGQPGAQVAPVGAGTVNGATTGESGPDQDSGGGSAAANVGGGSEEGGTGLPPLPSPDICEPYADTPAHRFCLWVVLREE